ncbi:MAG: hypothetical protein O7F15_04520 [Gammaproteobacteria bacterium]|nr:hypothetical protein [Gammaproteobacteria bacterium]
MRAGCVHWLCRLTMLFVPLMLPQSVLAVGAANIHWAYSTYFGTGT